MGTETQAATEVDDQKRKRRVALGSSAYVPPVSPEECVEQDRMREIWRPILRGVVKACIPPRSWLNSFYGGMKRASPKVFGCAYEEAFSDWARIVCGLRVARRFGKKGHEYDLLVCDKKIEIKGATRTPSGSFMFNQFRESHSYTHVAMWGLEPERAFLWIEEKATVMAVASNQHASEEVTRLFYPNGAWRGKLCDGSLVRAKEVAMSVLGADRDVPALVEVFGPPGGDDGLFAWADGMGTETETEGGG